MAKQPVDKVEDAKIITDDGAVGRKDTVDQDRQSIRAGASSGTTGARRRAAADPNGRSGIASRFDRFVLTAFKYLVVSVLSGAVLGVVAVLVMRQLPSQGTADQSAAMLDLQEQAENLRASHQELQTTVEQNSLLIAELSTPADGAEFGSMSTQLGEAEGELSELKGQLDLLKVEVRENRAQLAEVANSLAAVDETVAGAVDRLDREVAELTQALADSVPAEESASGSRDGSAASAGIPPSSEAKLETAGEEAPPPLGGRPASLIDVRDERLDELAQQIEVIREAAAESASASMEQIATVESALAQLSASVEGQQSDLQSLLAASEARVQDRQSGTDTATIVALLALRDAVVQGRPYRDILEADRVDLSTLPEVLRDHADTGVASLRTLQLEFEDYASAAMWVPEGNGEENGLSARAQRFLGSLIQVRSLQPQEGENVAAILSRATAATRSADVELAMTELQALPEQTLETLEEWTVQARNRLAAVGAVDALIVNYIQQADPRRQ